MALVVRIDLRTRRLFMFGHRIHHGLVGLFLILHDAHDWRVWLRDLLKHPSVR